jgi:hypothetical protein
MTLVVLKKIFGSNGSSSGSIRFYFGRPEFRPKEFSSRTFGPGRISGDFSDRDKISV